MEKLPETTRENENGLEMNYYVDSITALLGATMDHL